MRIDQERDRCKAKYSDGRRCIKHNDHELSVLDDGDNRYHAILSADENKIIIWEGEFTDSKGHFDNTISTIPPTNLTKTVALDIVRNLIEKYHINPNTELVK